ncbi:MAG: glucose-6-phosphate dehydrogenase [Parachlamydiaceae bacterium]|nr:glucose-6-phosphate dehydrogenase [Parachlamydiaceae bacterium]
MKSKSWIYIILFAFTILHAEYFQPIVPNPQLASEQLESRPCVVVLFGATGDLTTRKLLPALYNLAKEGHLSDNTVIVGYARRGLSNDTFREQMEKAIDQFSRSKLGDRTFWDEFKNIIIFHKGEFDNDSDYEDLDKLLSKIDDDYGTSGNRIYYLATQPSYFPKIIDNLHKHKLIYEPSDTKWSRVLIEKPFGDSLQTAIDLQKHISTRLHENQTYRIDHYLGKEGVQNLLALRFENRIFEPIWNHEQIDNIQITLSEDIGIGTRGNFWEETGALRDFFQNHLMQLLAIVAMEPPQELNAESIHIEKIKALKAVRPIAPQDFDRFVIRGQYGEGSNILGYRQEQAVSKTSNVETFMAATLFIDNERWKDVPFYIRGGKRLPKQLTEVAVTFKSQSGKPANTLFIRIQPDMGVFFRILSKTPGIAIDKVEPVTFGFTLSSSFSTPSPDAYEKLFHASILGDKSLFVDPQEQIIAWQLLTPVLQHWNSISPLDFPNYSPGSWGPDAAEKMLHENGHQWVTSGLK